MLHITQDKTTKKWLVSGFKDTTQENNLILKGFENKVFKVFNTEIEANAFIEGLK